MKDGSSEEKNRRIPGGGQEFPFRIQKPEAIHPAQELPDELPSPRRIPREDPGRRVLFVNLRTFLIVAVGMGVFITLAMFTSSRAWRMKEIRATSGDPALTLAEESNYFPRVNKSIRAEEQKWNVRLGGVIPLSDTGAIHQALLLTKQADSLVESGDTREAIDLYTEALTTWPHLTAARVKLGRLYLMTRDFVRAQDHLEIAAENEPGSPDLMNDLGVTYFNQRRITTAMKQFKATVQIDAHFAPSYFNLALCHLSMADQNGARDYLYKYLTLVPDDTRALKEKAFLDAAEGDYTNAMGTLQQALALDPRWPPLHFDAAATAALMGRGTDAIMHLEAAESLTSPSAVYLVYQQPAFRDVRLSEPGLSYLKELVERARERSGEKETYNPLHDVIEPLLSSPSAGKHDSAVEPPK